MVVCKTIQRAVDKSQLLNEMRLIAASRSRHVVEIFDIVLDDAGDVEALILEYLPGPSYEEFHKTTDFRSFVRAMYQIASGLEELHALGITHRDLKPDNFRDSSSGVLKLFDFGISNDLDGYLTEKNRGTHWYAAPELYSKSPEISPPLDIYALGICGWALSSRTLPSELRESPPQRSERAAFTPQEFGVPPAVTDLVTACVDPNPDGRPTASECVTVLKSCLVQNRHRGIFVDPNRSAIVEVDASSHSTGVAVKDVGSVRVSYDGTAVSIVSTTGAVFINNQQAQVGSVMPASCIVSFGPPEAGPQRQHVTFISSHPEVVL